MEVIYFGGIAQVPVWLVSYVQPKWFTEPKFCYCLYQGRTLNDILMRSTNWMAYFDLSKLKFRESFLTWDVEINFRGCWGGSYMCRSKVKGLRVDKLIFTFS